MADRHRACVIGSCVFLTFASGSLAQLRFGAASAQTGSERPRVAQVAPNFYVISNHAANLVLVVREDASLVAGVQRPELVTQAIATLQELKAPPVKYALLMDDDEAVRFAEGGWGARGAVTLAH